VIRKEVFNGVTEISRVDFFSFFQGFHDKVFKNPKIHKSAFRKTGLILLDPSIVLNKIKKYRLIQAARPVTPPPRLLHTASSPPLLSSSPGFNTPPPQTPTNWHKYSTPLTLQSRKKGVEYIRGRQLSAIEGTPITPSVIRVMDKVEKASKTSMLAGALST
jgi:hypothetical protein